MKHRLAQHIGADGNSVTTVCSCGARLVAVGTPDQYDHIVGVLGYPDVAAGTRDHDVTHARLAWGLGLGESPTLMRQVHGLSSYASDDLVALEEAAVLAAQKFVNAARREGCS